MVKEKRTVKQESFSAFRNRSGRDSPSRNAIYLLPVNLYSPGDNFALESSHVIPALIKKVLEAKARGEKYITVWGTGKATREFLYVEDTAECIVLAEHNFNNLPGFCDFCIVMLIIFTPKTTAS